MIGITTVFRPVTTFTVDWALNVQASACCSTVHHGPPSLISLRLGMALLPLTVLICFVSENSNSSSNFFILQGLYFKFSQKPV